MREPSGGFSPRRYLLQRNPPPKGPHGMMPRPSSWQTGSTSYSMFRSTSEYCGCIETNRASLLASLSATLFMICHAVKFETPT
jgi:hypothetical protein